MDNLNSILNKQNIVPGRPHLRIVNADPDPVQTSVDGQAVLPETPAPWRPLAEQVKEQRERQPRRPSARREAVLPSLPAPMKEKEQVCQKCGGTGWLRQDLQVGHPQFGKPIKCQCKMKQAANHLFGGSHIPDDFQSCTFESYLRLPLSPEQQKIATMVQAFVLARLAPYEGRKRGLYLYGLWGVGKTGLAVSALRMALEAGHSGLYLPTSELFDILYESIAASQRILRGYGDEDDREEETAGSKLLRLVDSVEWLVLDDLGVECGSRFVISRLYRIIEGRRSRRGLYTIFTSNKDACGLEQHWRPERPGAVAFDDCERIIQRIGEYCTPIHLTGRSLREK